jgi:SAM-dependent methyltransferase
MLEVARSNPEAVEWVPGFAEDLPFPKGSFDHVVSLFAAMFFRDRARAMEEMARVVVQEGSVTVVTWAELDLAPGYAAMASLLDDLFGPSAARAVTAPFNLGRVHELHALLEPAMSDVHVRSLSGEARFASIDSWIHTEIRGWTLADEIDDEQLADLVEAGRDRLRAFADGAGRVTFPVSALVGIGRRSSA